MITLYVRPTCPFCQRTMAAADELNVPYEMKDVDQPGVAEELEQLGGKVQMPFMVDNATDTKMYESEDIIAYLHEHFGKAAAE